ncbi:MAG: hypothetical protein ACJ735_02570 [Actinomycetes bacterium]
MTNDESRYELLALTDGEDASVRRVLGRYQSYEAALRARGSDVLRQLAATGGWYITIEHVIVGPGLSGPQTEHRHSTALGVALSAGRPPTAADLQDAADWLRQLRRRPRQR